jgi:NTP pyrophosphatase (non-canonical NTP hydrolase)
MSSFLTTIKALRKFNTARNWDKYHSPKNLVMALSKEVSELGEHMQWLTQEESYSIDRDSAYEELADILIYTLILCDKLNVRPETAIENKIKKNEVKYPQRG